MPSALTRWAIWRATRCPSPSRLAARTRTSERYVREWLEQQAVSGLLGVDDPAAPAGERRYRLPLGHAEVLVDRDDPAYASASARMMVGMVRPLPRVLEAFRSGGGVPFADYGIRAWSPGRGGPRRAAALRSDFMTRMHVLLTR